MKIEKTREGLSVTRGRPLDGALVKVEEDETTADEHGYYEILVAPGVYTVEASHPDYQEGQATCQVAPGGQSECDVPVYGDEPVIQGGCTTGGPTGSGLMLLALVLVFIRRQRY
jgi:MYXO-CTERM domain-containing protein